MPIKKSGPVSTKKTQQTKNLQKVHPWRLCPEGEHWVKTHPLNIPSSKKHPEGAITVRHGHCAKNPSGKDQLYPDEIQRITDKEFKNIKKKPCPDRLDFGEAGRQFDNLIAGWTQYWNETLKPESPLDPNLIKALIASESRFEPHLLAQKKDPNSARGLMQITNKTRKILANEKGELKNHYLTATREELNEPSVNICAGIRWLFRKREIASERLKRIASWEEAVFEFKGIRLASPAQQDKIRKIFNGFLDKYQKCEKS